MEKFRELGLSEATIEALAKKGFEEPTPIQAKTIPLLLKGERDIVGQAQTGTGKTAAFGLPLIEKLDPNNKNVQALIMCPTRELAIQVAEEISSFKGNKNLFVQPIYGGQSYEIQIRALKRGVQIVVGTPGRIRDHIEKGTLKLANVTHVVLDEADEMLNMGFEEEVREILKQVPAERRMLLFSATMPANILRLAKSFMKEYDLVEVRKEQLTIELTQQIYFEVRESERFEALSRIIDTEPEFYGIVFCRTKVETDNVSHKLMDRGYEVAGIHGDVTQGQREQILKKFKTKKITILVATDVAARGIDVNDLTHVINYNLPQDPEAYVHRIGRTGRAGKQGTAITFITPHEMRELLFIQKIARTTIKKEKVPTIKQVLEIKKQKLKSQILELIDNGQYAEYVDLAHELIDDANTAERVLAALLKFTFKDNMKEDSYQEIRETSSRSVDMAGTSRLFVAMGREDDMTPAKLSKFLEDEGGINQTAIKDVKVFDKFSFITVTFTEAEQLLAVFSKQKGRNKPLVTKAKDRDSGGGESRGRDNFKPRGDFKKEGGGFKKSFGGDKPAFGERKEYSSTRERKPFAKREGASSETSFSKPAEGGDFKKPFKRTNKLTDYLEKPSTENKPEKKVSEKKESFKPSFNDDDLSW